MFDCFISKMLHGKEMWMGIRVTGISTPVGGVSWEYTKAEKHFTSLPIVKPQTLPI